MSTWPRYHGSIKIIIKATSLTREFMNILKTRQEDKTIVSLFLPFFLSTFLPCCSVLNFNFPAIAHENRHGE